ncbi:hypothetical protein BV898_06185 [Hypsibius exemplaris]|uniref:Uncharacterized protein n=1 Tax=Hypsibius exemplaris TaxID=2072580 RepID=A0A1W0WXJ5_HYPEX|nr:hypothetical protein BV898_06185 [Hypsibius exemplaris]
MSALHLAHQGHEAVPEAEHLSMLEKVKHAIAHINEPVDTLPADYESRTAQQKMDYLWNKVEEHPYTAANLPTASESVLDSAKVLLPPFIVKAFLHVSDTMPKDRPKILHGYGSVAKIDFDVYPKPHFSGVFRSGAKGFIRLSILRLDYTKVLPGCGLKFLIDGQPSQNILLMHGVDGQGTDRNLFRHTISNLFPDPTDITGKLANAAFSAALPLLPGHADDLNRPEKGNNLGLYEQASVNAFGHREDQVVAPWKIVLHPQPDVQANQDAHGDGDFRLALAAIPEGTVLYEVVAHRTPDDVAGEPLGRIVTRSKFVSSKFGDELYFRHARHHHRTTPFNLYVAHLTLLNFSRSPLLLIAGYQAAYPGWRIRSATCELLKTLVNSGTACVHGIIS